MHGHHTKLAVLPDENSGRWPIKRARRMDDGWNTPNRVTSISVISWGRIEPPAAGGVKEPTAIVVRSPTPGLEAGEGPAEAGVPQPIAHRERRPPEGCPEGTPAIAVASAGRPSAIRI